MALCLADTNVWLALLVKEHVHHARALTWFESAAAGKAGLCRVVQLSLIRLLGTPAVMASGTLSSAAAWTSVQELLADERVEFLAEPTEIGSILGGLWRYGAPTRNLVMDAYLAAFAISANRALLTNDKGFRQFRGLHLAFLQP